MSGKDISVDVSEGGIKDYVKEAKSSRFIKRKRFMRRYNKFWYVVEKSHYVSLMVKAYDDMVQAFEALVKSHEDYVALVGKATIDAEGDYLGEALQMYLKMLVN